MSKRSGNREFHLRIPATTANLGPAFDAAGLGLAIYLDVAARPAAEFSVRAQGRDADVCGTLEKHLILETYRAVLAGAGHEPLPLALEINNAMPIGKGFGSSSAARVAGVALADLVGGLGFNSEDILARAAALEGHPDNAAACWLGGFVIARGRSEAEHPRQYPLTFRVWPPLEWPLLLAVPEEPLSTEAARRVLPPAYSRADAIANVQNSMLLAAAFMQGDSAALRAALHDRLHEPYREPLCPLLGALRAYKTHPEVVGVALSGAGPSVLMVLEPGADMERHRVATAEFLRQRGLSAELLATRMDHDGAVKSWERALA